MDEGDELEQAPLQRIKSNSVLATERLLAAKGLNAEQSVGRILSPHHHYYKKCIPANLSNRLLKTWLPKTAVIAAAAWPWMLQVPCCRRHGLAVGHH
eukprot:1153263-Pelagomonas_calceolata.AAC.11